MAKSILDKIETALNQDIRPVLSDHKGNVAVSDFTDGTLRIRLTGMCSSCPSASLTMEEIITEKLKAHIPEIKKVILITAVSDELISQARAMLRHEFLK
jgi:Fe-S cluster biogenesis protein NfuA